MVSTKINSKIRTLIPDNASEYFNKNPGSPIHSSSHPQDSPKPTSSEPVVPKSVIPDSIVQGRERKRYATVRYTLREYSLLLNLRVLLQLITGKKVLKLSLNLIPICCTILIYLLPLRMAREIVFNTLWPTLFFDNISASNGTLVTKLNSIYMPKTIQEALQNGNCRKAMQEDMSSLKIK